MGLHRLSLGIATTGVIIAALVPNDRASIVGFLLVGIGVATSMPRLYDDAARLPGRRGAGLGAMTAGMRVAFLITPVKAIFTIPTMIGLAAVTETNTRLHRRTVTANTHRVTRDGNCGAVQRRLLQAEAHEAPAGVRIPRPNIPSPRVRDRWQSGAVRFAGQVAVMSLRAKDAVAMATMTAR